MKKDNGFVMLAVVAVIFLVVLVATIIPAPEESTGHATAEDVTGTIWTCTWDNGYKWIGTKDEDVIRTINNKYASAGIINCDEAYWICNSGNECNADNIGITCECRKQITMTTQMPAGG